jgi:hypothetical protein
MLRQGKQIAGQTPLPGSTTNLILYLSGTNNPMFAFFKKKEPRQKISDIVFAKRLGKWNALLEAARREPRAIFVAWFEDSREKLQQFFTQHQQEAEIITARQVHPGIIAGRPVLFIEHYPLAGKERQVFASMAGTNITVYSSLDEAFFKYFGGDNISALLGKLGLEENEAISHTMITRSIANAQQKLATKVTIDQSAHSIEEWMRKNAGTIIPS